MHPSIIERGLAMKRGDFAGFLFFGFLVGSIIGLATTSYGVSDQSAVLIGLATWIAVTHALSCAQKFLLKKHPPSTENVP